MGKRALLADVPFTTQNYSSTKRTDDSYVMEWYFEGDGQEAQAFGRIQRIFEHTIPWSKDTETGSTTAVFVQCNWYSPVGEKSSSTNIVQVRRNHNWDVSGFIFLDAERVATKKFVLWRDDVFDGGSNDVDDDNDILYVQCYLVLIRVHNSIEV